MLEEQEMVEGVRFRLMVVIQTVQMVQLMDSAALQKQFAMEAVAELDET